MTNVQRGIPSTSMTRRRFLTYSALGAGSVAGAGALLQACSTSSSAPGTTTLTVMYQANEFLPAYISDFQKQHTDIKIHFLEYDAVRLSAMLAAGQPPDFIRTGGAAVMPNLIARGLVADLTPYFEKSTAIKTSDLYPVNDVYRWNGKVQGLGARYGMAKDWSQDTMLWYNKKLFDKAGVAYPSATQPMTYDQMLAIGEKLTVKSNGKIQIYGLDPTYGAFTQGRLIQMVVQQGGSIYSDDYTKADLTTPEARAAIKWYVDWAQAHVGPSPLDPGDNWSTLFPADRAAMVLFGYWFSGEVASWAAVQDHVGFAPAPVMGPKRVSPCLTGTGAWIPAASKKKDAAWTLMEYFMAGKPAHDRASSGWGIPSLKSLASEMPKAKPFQQQAYEAVQNELPYLEILHFSPYISDDAFSAAFTKTIEPVMHGQVSLESGISQFNDAINLLLQQGKQQVS